MNVIAIIPARMGSTRFPGKPLYKISGIPMIGHCFYRTRLAKGLSGVYVATCDKEIANYVESINGKIVMTSPSHTRATGRSVEAIKKIETECGHLVDVVLMVQGDEPLILPEDLSKMIQHFETPDIEIVNLMAKLKTRKDFENKNNVKVVVKQNMDALYFSREPIPSMWKGEALVPMFMQIGAIAFRRNVLTEFEQMEETLLEIIESVDMNRILETGGKIKMVLTDAKMIGVDTLEEAENVSKQMENDIIIKEYYSM